MRLLNSISIALFAASLLAGVPIFEAIRTAVNEKLSPEYRFRFFRGRMGDEWWGHGGLFSMHAQFFPDSRLRILFWLDAAMMFIAVVLAAIAQSRINV